MFYCYQLYVVLTFIFDQKKIIFYQPVWIVERLQSVIEMGVLYCQQK
jgi:hypothetical protein